MYQLRETHHTSENIDCHAQTAFFNRFETVYLDINVLKDIGIDTNKNFLDLNEIMLQCFLSNVQLFNVVFSFFFFALILIFSFPHFLVHLHIH